MKKQEYVSLVSSLYKALGIAGATPSDGLNSFEIGTHGVALMFDETEAPDTIFILVNVGARALDIDRSLLEFNAAIPSTADGHGCYARWPGTGDVVYRAQWPFTATAKAEDLAKSMAQVASLAVSGLPVAHQ
ncbi:hypothetical protein [Hydrogenophaga sp.]|mgnify:FL=1|jgi:hypothetical protein|uniref:hypothetical protein n=1 Tax=Hydrogenophaga sp. TaxID=1904254 RepID=UPI000EBCDD29|nr:hypothetical protein [Hydrogenophaga sp.]MDZ4360816.1 hypothetical protein [Variovorax sp.]RJP65321.1 MAG: hypothetical protein C4535_15395 [Comamonadaceae bacterium]